MNGPNSSEPLDELRRANPVDADRLPAASLARVRARVREQLMTDSDPEPDNPRARRVAIPALVATAAVVLVAIAVLGRGGTAPPIDPSTGPGVGACIETYSLETLRNRSFAFDGTVETIHGDQVTFRVNEAYRGTAADVLTLTAPGVSDAAITSAGGASLTIGERYLVAGDDRFVWACGFTQPYDSALAAEWADALRS